MSHTEKDMIALFDSIDKNSDGSVSIKELKAGIREQYCPDITDQQACVSTLKLW